LKPKGKLPILSDAEDVASVANSGILSRNDLKQRAFSIKPSNAVMDAILEQARNKNDPSHNRSGSLSKLSPSLADSDYSRADTEMKYGRGKPSMFEQEEKNMWNAVIKEDYKQFKNEIE
jgi:hypothetical protein